MAKVGTDGMHSAARGHPMGGRTADTGSGGWRGTLRRHCGMAKAGVGVAPGFAERMLAGGKRRGVLFTVSMLLLSMSLLSFASYLAEQAAKSTQTSISLLEIDRTSDTYADLETELARILSTSIGISVDNSTVLLNETLPVRAGTDADFDRFAQFERNFSDLNISMNLTNLKAGSLLVQPGEIAITHSQTGLNITPKNSQDSAGSVGSYDINITFQSMGADGAAWDALSNSSQSQTAVHIRVQDAIYSFNFDTYQNVDKYGASRLNITQGGALVGYVQFAPPSAVQVYYASNIGLKASIGLSTRAYVEANDTISVTSASSRTGNVRIA